MTFSHAYSSLRDFWNSKCQLPLHRHQIGHVFFVELQNRKNRNSSREGSKVRPKEFSLATYLDDVAFGGQTAGKLRDEKRLALCRGPSFRSFTAGPLLPTFGLGSFNSTDLPLFLSLSNVAMLSRAFWRSPALQALPKRQVYGLARRTVTTDAASAHAEKEDVPAVSIGQLRKTSSY